MIEFFWFVAIVVTLFIIANVLGDFVDELKDISAKIKSGTFFKTK